MKNLKLLPYKMGSESAKVLAQLLDIKRVRGDGQYRPRSTTTVVNWGSSRNPNFSCPPSKLLNKPESVNMAANKLTALRTLQTQGIITPEFTTDINVARNWLNQGSTVVERHNLRGHSGQGIRIVNLEDTTTDSYVTQAPLYTKFLKKTGEFRVHVFKGQVIDYIQKLKTPSDRRPANFNQYISSLDLGWVFSRTDALDLPIVKQIAVRAVAALHLDFGAVDVIYSNGQAYVLEVNTSPGLGGTTLVNYANALRRHMGLGLLPDSVTRPLLDRVTSIPVQPQPVRPYAAISALVDGTTGDEIVWRMDRATALRIRSLLAGPQPFFGGV